MPAKKTLKRKKPAKKRQDGALALPLTLIKPTYRFLLKNTKDLFIKFLKVGLLSMLVGALLLVIMAAITYLLAMQLFAPFTYLPSFWTQPLESAAFIIWVIISLLFIKWMTSSISLTTLLITKEGYEKKYSGVWPTFNQIKFQVLPYMLVNLSILVVALGIPLLLVFLLPGALMWIALSLFILYALVFILVYYFFTQFWLWELLITKKGIFQSLKRSINLVRNNLGAVFVYDVIVLVISTAVAVPFTVAYSLLGDFFGIGMSLSAVSLDMMAIFAGIGVYLLFIILIEIIQSALRATFTLPYQYSYWSKLGESNG